MKRILLFIISALMLLSFAACAPDAPGTEDTTVLPGSDTTDRAPEASGLDIVKDGESAFTLIRSERSTAAITQSVVNIKNDIKDKTGAALGVSDDWNNDVINPYDPESFEILVGDTNRAESIEVLASLPENSYTVTARGNKLVIIGTDDNLTVLALHDFEKNILKNSDKCSKGMLVFAPEDSITVTLEGELTVKEMLSKKYKVQVSAKSLFKSPRQDDCYVAQGAASDGTYAYFVLRNADDTAAVINKHKLDGGALVATARFTNLGHGNDMTYDAKNHRLVVSPSEKTLVLIDPDTLELISTVNISAAASGITYSVERDQYAISKGGKSLNILDSNFKAVKNGSRSDNTGYTVQGMGSDEECIYFIMSGNNTGDNVLVVYTWEGRYLGIIKVPVSYEGESMYWVNGKYYTIYHIGGTGPIIYETEFSMYYE